ncbi:hypothetical protein [Modestobacter marinus]|uniref:hypothetical protein n=1 Tax=Modestobacter marinus TaxID=477641 RepID=UPI001C976CB7|nr:hypothetical protein [Modestobacter marinus]
MDPATSPLLTAADALEALAARTTGGSWERSGLLASRPEVVARAADGSTVHVAEARAATVDWITALSPALAAPLADWLREAARSPAGPAALAVARAVLAGVAPDQRSGPLP